MAEKIYEIVEHPADLKLEIFGASLESLFCNLVQAIASEQMAHPHRYVSKLDLRSVAGGEIIEIEAPDLFSLLVDFASEIIYRSDANGKVYTNCKIIEVSETRLRARISGVVAKKKLDIKAATYHEGYVKKVDNCWEAVILFDI